MAGNKPLGGKAYGSIPHMSGSKMDQSDKRVHEGQERMLTVKTKSSLDTVVVQEKVDGSCCSIANIDGEIVPLTRAGYRAATSPYEQHHMFGSWVMSQQDRFTKALPLPGYRIVGEWMVQAHGTFYCLPHEPFVAFDIIYNLDGERWTYMEMLKICNAVGLATPRLISYGPAISIDDAMRRAKWSGHGAVDPVEGVVYRYEVDDKVSFLAKYVRPDKKDGKYLPEINGGEPMWNDFPPSTHTIKWRKEVQAK